MLVGGLAVASCFCPALAPIAIAAFTGYVSGLAISVGTSLVTSTIQNGFGNYDWNAIAKQANKDAFWGAFSGAAFAGIGAAASNVLSKAGPKAAKSIRDVASYTNKVDDYIDDAVNLTDDILNSADDVVKGSTNTVNPNALKYNGDGAWTSNSGLIYGQGSKEGNRVLHVLEHTKPNPNKPVHTVFNVDKSNVIGLVDEAWNSRGVGNLASNGYVTYNIDMGKTIGTNGETFMRIVTNGYTNKLISAYPIP